MIKEHIKAANNLLKINKAISIIMMSIFLIGVFAGFTLPSKFKLTILKSANQKFESILSDSNLSDFLKIFLNNSIVGLLLIVLGFTVVLPAAMLFINGLVLGVVADLIVRIGALNLSTFLLLSAGLLPHGLIEIPSLIICGIFGTIIGLKLFFRNRIMPKKKFRALLMDVAKVYILVIVPALMLSAFIEVYVTPSIGSNALNLWFRDFEDLSLNDAILSKDDLLNLGIPFNEVPIMDYFKMASDKTVLEDKSLRNIDLFYDDEMYSAFKKLRNKPMASKIFINEQNKLTLFIIVSKSNSGEEAREELSLYEKIFNLTDYGGNASDDLGSNFFKIKHGNAVGYQKYGNVGAFFYSIKLAGDNTKNMGTANINLSGLK